jgi:hypothetical protein
MAAPQGDPLLTGEATRNPTWCDKIRMNELDPTMRSAYYWFAGGLALLLGTGSMIQPATTTTFITAVPDGYDKIPTAQTWLFAVYLPVLFLYNFLFNTFKSSPMIVVTIMCVIYGVIYLGVGIDFLVAYDWKHMSEG